MGLDPLTWINSPASPSTNGRGMNRSEQIFHSKPDKMPKSASKPIAGRQDEALWIFEEYANDLRQIVAKRLH
jgi:hypothetical protein